MSKRLLVYVAGAYSAPTPEGIAANVAAAAEVGQQLMRAGYSVICPHTMTHNWDIGTGLTYEDFLRQGLDLLERCDAICLVGAYGRSKGTMLELQRARELGLQVFDDVPEVEA